MFESLARTPSPSFMPAPVGPAAIPDARVLLWRTADNQGHYWPCDLLHAFTLQMAAGGLSVSTDMMLGDHIYARERLAAAHSCGDARLRDLAVQLFGFFEARAEQATAGACAGVVSH